MEFAIIHQGDNKINGRIEKSPSALDFSFGDEILTYVLWVIWTVRYRMQLRFLPVPVLYTCTRSVYFCKPDDQIYHSSLLVFLCLI